MIKKEMITHLVADGKIILQTPARNAERAIMRRNTSEVKNMFMYHQKDSDHQTGESFLFLINFYFLSRKLENIEHTLIKMLDNPFVGVLTRIFEHKLKSTLLLGRTETHIRPKNNIRL